MSPLLANTRIVLVRPHFAGNVGAVARVMANFGLHDLVLVDPYANLAAHEARSRAAGGVHVLDAARIMSYAEALADCHCVLATAGLVEGTWRATMAGTPGEWLPKLAEHLADGPAAIVFGPEPHGLTTDEISRCQGLIQLPSHPDCPSFNLSMAVGITLSLLHSHVTTSPSTLRRRPAPFAELERALDHLEQSFHHVNYLFGQNADHLMHGFRHLIRKAEPTPVEVRMLHGLAAQLDHIARTWKGEPAND